MVDNRERHHLDAFPSLCAARTCALPRCTQGIEIRQIYKPFLNSHRLYIYTWHEPEFKMYEGKLISLKVV